RGRGERQTGDRRGGSARPRRVHRGDLVVVRGAGIERRIDQRSGGRRADLRERPGSGRSTRDHVAGRAGGPGPGQRGLVVDAGGGQARGSGGGGRGGEGGGAGGRP